MKKNILSLTASLLLCLILFGCGHKKIVAKNCEQASNSGFWLCDPQ